MTSMNPQPEPEPFRLIALPPALWGKPRMLAEFHLKESQLGNLIRAGRIPGPCLRRDGCAYWNPVEVQPSLRQRLKRLGLD
jgi:hypothetical protein